MLSRSHHQYESLNVIVYDFDHIGDVLAMHEHSKGGAHISVISRGAFKAKGAGWEKDLPLGAIVDWKAELWHEFEAIEPNSRLVNIVK